MVKIVVIAIFELIISNSVVVISVVVNVVVVIVVNVVVVIVCDRACCSRRQPGRGRLTKKRSFPKKIAESAAAKKNWSRSKDNLSQLQRQQQQQRPPLRFASVSQSPRVEIESLEPLKLFARLFSLRLFFNT